MNKITDEQIERKIKNAIDDMTPDMLDDLMSELDSATVTEFPENPIPKRHRKRKWYTAVASCAAALLIFVGAFSMLHKADDVCAVVSLDVNPSVELSINTDNQVLSAKALNSDGEKILGGMELARRVPAERVSDVLRGNSAAVVCNSDQRTSALCDLEGYRSRSGVDGILDQLLRNVKGTLDHLSGGNLVNGILIEKMNCSFHGHYQRFFSSLWSL